MVNEQKFTRFSKLMPWLISGGSFTAAVIATINNSEFILRRAIGGSLLVAGLWCVAYLFIRIVKIKPAETSRMKMDIRHHLVFVGAIVVLWMPLLFVPFKTQKVEIVLDVSSRMWEQFDKPGTTKFDAAQSGVLEVLDRLENQNIQVALRLVKGNGTGQCEIAAETSLAVDFTKDFDKIRSYLATIKPNQSEKAPVVDTLDLSINHYLGERTWDKRFYLYSFLGGDDTCEKKLGVFLLTPKVVENAITSEIFLIILLGTNEEIIVQNLPNARLDYARTVIEVSEIVKSNNELIQVPTPVPTSSPTLLPSPSSTSYLSGGGYVVQTVIVEDKPKKQTNDPQPSNQNEATSAIITQTYTPSATLLPPPTSTQIQFSSSTAANTPIPPTPVPPTPIPQPTSTPSPYVELLSASYVGSGEGCSALINFQVSGSPATGNFHVWNAFYGPEGDIYGQITLPVGPNGYQVVLGGYPTENYWHEVWFEYNGVSSNRLTGLICPGLTPSP